MGIKKPWCCVIECDADATWGLFTGASPDDNTQSCNDHVAQLLGTDPLIGIEALA